MIASSPYRVKLLIPSLKLTDISGYSINYLEFMDKLSFILRYIYKVNSFLLRRLLYYCTFLVNSLNFYLEDISIGKKHEINGRIFIKNLGKLMIGDNFKANSGNKYNPIGGDIILRLICLKNAELIIGNNVGISNSTIYCASRIVVEDNVAIGGGCKIWDTDFHSLDPTIRLTPLDNGINIKNKSVCIKKNAFIGGGVVILKGVTIGENSVIGAYSLVSTDVPANEIWGGNPAKFIKKLNK